MSNEEAFAKVVIPSPEEIEVNKQKILGIGVIFLTQMGLVSHEWE